MQFKLELVDCIIIKKLHAVWVYKKHPYKKRIVDFLKIKKQQLSINNRIRNANYFKRQRRKEKATVLKSKLLF